MKENLRKQRKKEKNNKNNNNHVKFKGLILEGL